MCDFCEGTKAIANVFIDCGFLGDIQVKLDFRTVDCERILELGIYNTTSFSAEYEDDYIEQHKKINISYCPMCGRKLV